MIKPFTLVVFTENNPGLIVRLVTMISRRRIHIEGVHVESYAEQKIYRFVLSINETEETVRKLMLQIDKQVEVFKSFYHSDEAIVMEQQDQYFQIHLARVKTEIKHAIFEDSII
ncbi:ACT domain-containing protein [Flavitalea antarctica]